MRNMNFLKGFRSLRANTGTLLAAAAAWSTVAGGAAAIRLEAGERPPCPTARTKVAIAVAVDSNGEETRVVLAELNRLRHPVKVRVETCESELAAAHRDVMLALQRHQAAKANANKAIGQVETVSCVLRTMCQTLEVNGAVFTKDQVADGLRLLCGKYRTASAAVESAAVDLDRCSETLRQVATRVEKWRNQERALLEQVDALRTEHRTGVVANKADGIRTANATKLIKEVSEMLAKPAPARVSKIIVESSANAANREPGGESASGGEGTSGGQSASGGAGKNDGDNSRASDGGATGDGGAAGDGAGRGETSPEQPASTKTDRLLEEVDRLLSEKSATEPR